MDGQEFLMINSMKAANKLNNAIQSKKLVSNSTNRRRTSKKKTQQLVNTKCKCKQLVQSTIQALEDNQLDWMLVIYFIEKKLGKKIQEKFQKQIFISKFVLQVEFKFCFFIFCFRVLVGPNSFFYMKTYCLSLK